MPRSLVLGMNDHQGLYWVLIVVTLTHRPLAAKCGSSIPRSHRHKVVLSPVALTTPAHLQPRGCKPTRPGAAAEKSRQGRHVAASLQTVLKGRAITYGTSSPRLPWRKRTPLSSGSAPLALIEVRILRIASDITLGRFPRSSCVTTSYSVRSWSSCSRAITAPCVLGPNTTGACPRTMHTKTTTMRMGLSSGSTKCTDLGHDRRSFALK